MSGNISASGLISGIDSGQLIASLMQIERQPIVRFETRISQLEKERNAIRDVRTQLLSLRNRAQDFRFNQNFTSFAASSSETKVLNAIIGSANPAIGSYEVNVLQLASATVANSNAAMGSPIDSGATLNNSGISTAISSGTFSINGVEFNVDPDTQSLEDVLAVINSSTAGVTASYDAASDKVVIENNTPGDTSVINFGVASDEGSSNILAILGLRQANQVTGVNGSTVVRSTHNLGAIGQGVKLDTVNFANGSVTGGVFSINGVTISIDPETDALSDIIDRINNSGAQVTASYDATTDGIRIVSNTLGSRTVRFGSATDTSNFLSITNLANASQIAGNDARFTINNGSELTRNTNEISDAIGGVTINLMSVGTSSVTVSNDIDSIIENIKSFIDEYNTSVNQLRDLTSSSGDLRGDSSIRSVETFLRMQTFNNIEGISGAFRNLTDIGITTGRDFDSEGPMSLTVDVEKLREALLEDRQNVSQLFSNNSDTGIADVFYKYLDDVTKSTGYLNNRSKANGVIDRQIESVNDQIRRLEDRLEKREERLRRQFVRLEQLSSSFQGQSQALSGLSLMSFL